MYIIKIRYNLFVYIRLYTPNNGISYSVVDMLKIHQIACGKVQTVNLEKNARSRTKLLLTYEFPFNWFNTIISITKCSLAIICPPSPFFRPTFFFSCTSSSHAILFLLMKLYISNDLVLAM